MTFAFGHVSAQTVGSQVPLAELSAQENPAATRQETPAPAVGNETPAGAAKADDKIFEELDRAQKLYLESIELMARGKQKAAKKSLSKALDILSSLLVQEGLTEASKPDFENILDKIREAQSADDLARDTETPSALLGVTKEELAAPADKVSISAGSIKKYTISINPDDSLVQRYLTFYAKGPRQDAVLAALERSGRYRNMIISALEQSKLPPELFYLVMVESEYKIKGYSPAGAAGLWQLMSPTARKLGLKVNYWIDERYDPEKSTLAAIKYLKELRQHFDDWHLALAAYNRGEYGIERDLKFSKAVEFFQLSDRQALPQETEHFVPKFMACVLLGENPKGFGFNPKYEEPQAYDTVTLPKPLDLKIAAQSAGVSEEEIQRLNPAIRAWCTPINYPDFELKIPKGAKEKFLEELAKVKDWNPSRGFVRYKVMRGDVLSKIAKRYNTSVQDIMKDNKIGNSRLLRPGQILTVRPGRKFFAK